MRYRHTHTQDLEGQLHGGSRRPLKQEENEGHRGSNITMYNYVYVLFLRYNKIGAQYFCLKLELRRLQLGLRVAGNKCHGSNQNH